MRTALVGALVILVGLSGCQKSLSAQDLAGKWTGKPQISDADILKQIKPLGGTEKDVPAFKKKMEENPVPLVLNKDMTFALGAGMGEGDGTWTFEKDMVTLTLTKAGGKTVEELIKQAPMLKDALAPIKLTVSKEGKEMDGALQNPGGAAMKLHFSREAAKS
ncbi:MAG: hypothetical protein JSS66_18540 [Armatimonadetes bacterium]|nr:hypothetical protein [Armatimonadota bacterium]